MDYTVNMAPSFRPDAIDTAAIVVSGIMKQPPWKVTTSPDDLKLKQEFAELLLRSPHNAFEVARAVTGDDEKKFGLTWVRSKNWPTDPVVKAHQAALIEQFGRSYFLPTREDLAHNLWARVNARDVTGRYELDPGNVVGYTRLVAELAGYVGRTASDAAISDNRIQQNININFVGTEPTKQIVNSPTVIDNIPPPSFDAVEFVETTAKDDGNDEEA